MKFFGLNNTIVWDAENGKALCQFKDGIFETTDPEQIAKLKSLKYEFEPEPIATPEVKPVNKGGRK